MHTINYDSDLSKNISVLFRALAYGLQNIFYKKTKKEKYVTLVARVGPNVG